MESAYDHDFNAPPQRASHNARNQTDYKERSPLDLIEEDKRPFAFRKLLSTFLGGLRVVYNESEQKSIHPILLLT